MPRQYDSGTFNTELGDQMEDGYDWRKDASCIGIAFLPTPNPFFKQGRGEVYKVARKFCSGCPVVVDCLLAGIDEDVGFLGCMSVTERTNVRRSVKLGKSFHAAVEKVWGYHRKQGKDKAPSKSVWKEWEV